MAGVVTVQVDATDPEDTVGSLTVEVSIDGGTYMTAAWNGASSRYEFSWNTVAETDASHTIDAKATDTGFNVGNATQTTANVDNSNPDAYGTEVLADGPVAFWRLGELSGTSAGDATGTGHSATYQGSPSLGVTALADRTTDTAVDFDGVNDAVLLTDSVDINLGGPYSARTIELWFNADEVTSRQVVFEEGGLSRGISLYVLGGQLYGAAWNILNDGPGTPWGVVSVSTPVSAGQTYHAVLVLDDVGDNLELYVNGASADSVSGVGPLFIHGNDGAIGAMRQYASFHDTTANNDGLEFNGTIDEVALYNIVVDAAMVSRHYGLGSGDVTPTVSITSPADLATVSGTELVTLTATDPEDPVGSLTVEVSIDGGAFVPAVWNAGMTRYEYSWDTTLETDGVRTIDARATDSVLNVGNALQISVTVDNTAPDTVDITNPVHASTVSGLLLLKVDATDAIAPLGSLTVEVSIDGGAWQAAPWNTVDAYEFSWNTVLETDGSHLIDARATDTGGNTSNATQIMTTVDNVGNVPVVSITAPVPAETVSGNPYTVSVDATDDIDPVGSLAVEVSIDGGAFTAAAWNGATSRYELAWDTTLETEATHTVDARATDAGLNVGNAAQVGVTVDNDDAPAAAVTNPVDLSTVSGSVTVQVDATDTEDVAGSLTVEVSIDGGAFTAAAWNGATSRYELVWDTTLETDGAHTVDARATDSKAQTTNATQVSVTVDNVVDEPVVAITNPLDAGTVSGSVTIQVDATDDIDPVGSLAVEVSIDGGAFTAAAWNGATSRYELAWDTTLETEATHTVDARATDAGLNVGNAAQVGVTVDNDDAPAAAVTNPVDLSTVSGSVTVQVDATDTEDVAGSLTVEVSIDGGAFTAAAWNGATSRYELVWDTTLETDGAHTVDARATDSKAQTTNATQVSVTVDNVVDEPVVAITNPLDAGTVSGSVTIQVDATDDIDPVGSLAVEVSIDGGAFTAAAWNGATSRYELAWDTTLETEATHTVDARATDAGLNVGNAAQVGVTVDNDDAPAAAVTNPVDLSTVSGSVTVQVDATDTEDVAGSLTVEVSIDGGAFTAAAWNGATSRYELVWDTTLETDGAHTVDARATDSKAQTTNATQVSVTVDNTVPDMVDITNPVDASTVSGSVTVQVDATDVIAAAGTLTVEVSIDGAAFTAAAWNGATSRYELAWNTTLETDGVLTIDARATDDGGNLTDAAQVSVTIDNTAPSTVDITNPVDLSTVFGSVTVQVDAVDAVAAAGTLTVEVSIDGGAFSAAAWNGATSRYELAWDTNLETEGAHTIDARATDDGGNLANATQISVTVDNDDAPAAAITSPVAASTVSGTVTVQVDATDTEDGAGTLTVEVSIDGGAFTAAAWNGATSRYELAWDTTLTTDGVRTVDARATDSKTQTTNATQISVTVDNTAPSTVAITNPVDASNVAGTVIVQVDATDAIVAAGSLTVEVSIDSGAFAAAAWNGATSRYELSWDTTLIADGSHTVDARATDDGGNVTNATQISVDTGLAPEVLADGPVGYWRLGEASGTTAGDAAVPADDGTYVGAPTLGVTGLVSGIDTAVGFDGVDDTVTASLTGLSTTLRTVELWFSADTVVSRQVLAQVSNPASGVAVYLDGTDLWISSWNATQGTVSGSMTVAAGTTYHLVVVYDTAGTFEAYLDGSATAAITVAGATGTLGAAMDVTIGSVTADIEFHDGPGAGGNFFDGVIDEVAVYDTVLTTTRITAHNTAATAV